MHNSIGSKKEIESQIVLAFRAGYMSEEKRDVLLKELDEIVRLVRHDPGGPRCYGAWLDF